MLVCTQWDMTKTDTGLVLWDLTLADYSPVPMQRPDCKRLGNIFLFLLAMAGRKNWNFPEIWLVNRRLIVGWMADCPAKALLIAPSSRFLHINFTGTKPVTSPCQRVLIVKQCITETGYHSLLTGHNHTLDRPPAPSVDNLRLFYGVDKWKMGNEKIQMKG